MKSKTDKLDALRHSASHIMAQAVLKLFPGTKFAIGPSIENGFYYDFEFTEKMSEEALSGIEHEMGRIIREEQEFICEEITKKEARGIFGGQPYKLELIDGIEGDKVSTYRNGDFIDLCKGPHVRNTSEVKHFKLLKLAGAYWRGDEKNKMLTRIYGTVFPSEKELEEYIRVLELAKERDHRKLGKEMDLFSIHEDIGPGLIYWHPRGAMIRKVIEDFWREEHIKNGYELLFTPHIAKIDLWNTSGHTGFYKDNMFSTMNIDEMEYQLKPMNCPFHIMIYKTGLKSYRDLPLRWCELGTVYRYEKSGVLHGLMRVRGFTQDDAHIFCREDQLQEEIIKTIEFVIFILKTFGFEEYEVYLSTRPEKCVGDLKMWEKAEEALKKALIKTGLVYEVDPGEGVFYGPKIDIKIKDALMRTWQCSTIQVDFNIPERFDMTYVDNDGREKRTIMIHRALLGSLERFFGVLLEHHGGRFPLWLAPVQVDIIPIKEEQAGYAVSIMNKLKENGIRARINDKDSKLGKKIWSSRQMNVPYMAIAGDKEVKEGRISVRKLTGGDLGAMEIDNFIDILKEEIFLKK
ncbi:MAG: threonine--tRNA ligase [Elusimicrobia bacterium]|nr:threonine--tRNA ligase [Elusimicrobiota bacterium]